MTLRYFKSYSISNASSDNSLIPDTPSSNPPPPPPPHIQCRLGAEVCTVLGIKKITIAWRRRMFPRRWKIEFY